MALSIRTRVFFGAAAPALVAVVALCALVFVRVRADRYADLDRSLAERAASLASQVEREHAGARWEADFEETGGPAQEIVGRLSSWRIEDVDGGRTLWASSASSAQDTRGTRTWAGELLARSEDDVRPVVRVIVTEDARPLELELRGLFKSLVIAAALLALVSLLVARVVSARIVDPLARMAAAAARVHAPSAAPLPLSGADDEVDQLARALNDAFARTHAAYAQQARFAADASHELRTPLSVVKTESEVTLRKERTPEEYRASLTRVGEAANRMHDLVEALLVLARADAASHGDAARGLVDVAEIVRGVCDALAPADAAQVRVEIGADRARVHGDERQLSIVVRNLVGNALGHAAGAPVVVRVRTDDTDVHVDVEDEGPGIAPDDAPHVFERFWRADAARSRATGGAGLGLAIVKQIVEQHGGTVTVASTLGRGARFSVRIARAFRSPSDRARTVSS